MDESLAAKIDDTIITKMTWYYEHMGTYKHSYVILEADTCPVKNYCVFVSEKNKLGVQWYNWHEHDPKVTWNHNGTKEWRT